MVTDTPTGAVRTDCWVCSTVVEADDVPGLGEAFLAHVRGPNHDLPYSDDAIRNYAEATQRMTGAVDRVPELAEVTIHPVTRDRVDDWLNFFDHEAFAAEPHNAQCYCMAPHPFEPRPAQRHWSESRAAIIDRLRAGETFGYLAYVDGCVAAWVNASRRRDYNTELTGATSTEPSDGETIGISCFVIAPPYRRHGLATKLLDHVVAEAAARGASWVEAYPGNTGLWEACRGFRDMYEERGFQLVEERERDRVVRIRA